MESQTVDFNSNTNKGVLPFIAKLFRILNDSKNEDIIAWVRGGTCLLIKKERVFTEQILMHDFKCLMYSSFRRQLNNYGFTRVMD
jgi:hypothetical protein